jgi:hypothetical protein
MYSLLLQYFSKSEAANKDMSLKMDDVPYNITVRFLVNDLWPRVLPISLCHDSVACKNWSRSFSFPVDQPAGPNELLGQTYDQHHEVVNPIKNWVAASECSGRNKVLFDVGIENNQNNLLTIPSDIVTKPVVVSPSSNQNHSVIKSDGAV